MNEFDLIWTDEEKQEAEKEAYNKALEDFEIKMAFFCFGLKASQGNMCRVDVVEDELLKVKRQLKKGTE